jgi:outer membrane protein OmpA-like peptidoglycan-associated protein
MMPARQAAQTAEDARLVGLQRQEEAFVAAQKSEAAAREQDAVNRARAEEARRRQAELDAQTAAAARAAAERQTQESAARAQAALIEQRAAQQAKADADRARAEAENARAQAEAARLDAEAQAGRARQLVAQSEQEKVRLREQLRQQLNVILETRETARGLIVNLSDVLFDTARADLKPGAREKLARVSGILASHPGLRIEVEGHTDSVGTDEYNQQLSERRAESVRGYLVSQRIPSGTVSAIGLGEQRPVASNDNAAGRQQNRRVELIVSGDVIGTN